MKKMMTVAALLTAGLSSFAHAQAGPADPWGDATVARADEEKAVAERFSLFDTDKDGAISAEEMAASAQGQRRPGGGMRADANGDGKIGKDEYLAAQLRRFDAQDADGDGQLTKAERDAARAAMMERMQNGGGWGGQ